MKIEILYPNACNLYGDSSNVIYLKKCFSKATFYETYFNDKPKFITEDINLIYLGSSSEDNQEIIIKELMPYKKEIKEYIENDKIIIATGNALEIFGSYIKDEDKKIECLNLFNTYTIRNMKKRHNSLFLGTYKNIEVVGHKSQFTFTYNEEKLGFIKLTRGVGINKESKYEGIHYHNFYGTYLLGPFLIINPLMTKEILNIKELPFEKEIMDAYNYRLSEFKNPNTEFVSKH